MQHFKTLRCFLLVLFICVVSQSAFSHNKTFNKPININVTEGISQDSIPKSEIADFRKRFESVEKMVSRKMGNYADVKRSFDALSSSRVRSLPEFAGRYSAMQQKLTAWNLEVNPKTPPVVVPNNPNPSTPRNTGKTSEPVAKVTDNLTEQKSLMHTYFPDTLTVGNEFLAYVEITKDNTVKFGNLNTTNNSTLDSIILSSAATTSGLSLTQVTVELTRDGGADNFTINSRSDKTRAIGSGTGRWEWNLSPNSEGETRLRLSVTYQKQGADGVMQEIPVMNKFIVVKGITHKISQPAAPNYLPWIIIGAIVLLALIGYALSRGKKNKHERNRAEQNRLDQERIEQSRNEQQRINRDRDDLNR